MCGRRLPRGMSEERKIVSIDFGGNLGGGCGGGRGAGPDLTPAAAILLGLCSLKSIGNELLSLHVDALYPDPSSEREVYIEEIKARIYKTAAFYIEGLPESIQTEIVDYFHGGS